MPKVFFIVLIGIGLSFALYPFRKSLKGYLVMIPLFVFAATLGYLQWGSYYELHQHEKQKSNIAEVKGMLQTQEGRDTLIQKIKSSLDKNPTDVKGWQLLGRLYVRFGNCTSASDALAHAYQLRSKDEDIAIEYAQSLFVCNNDEFNEHITSLVNSVIEKNPKHFGAMAMLAREAYNRRQNSVAIEYWKKMLSQLSTESEDAINIRKMIDMATSRKE